MSLDSTLAGWVDGAPPTRDDGGLAIVVLKAGVRIDGQDPGGMPVIVSRWSEKPKTTAGAHRLSYDDVSRHIDIAAGESSA